MRIVFICGALEHGRDGVGDYARLLACELIRQGHHCGILALNDHFVSAHTEALQSCDGIEIATVRLSNGDSWRSRAAMARKWVADFSPDLVSLQFVPYAFHPKGLSIEIAGVLSEIAGKRNIQIMFHETWIGFSKIHAFKHRIYGLLQRHLATRLVRCLKPIRIHTSNLLYQLLLSEQNVESDILPIFSNIPASGGGNDWITGKLSELGIVPEDRRSWMILGIFGSIHLDFCPKDVLQRAVKEAKSKNLRVALIVVGRAGSGLPVLEAFIEKHHVGEITFAHFGEQPSDHVSQFCRELDYAVATMPREFMDKSGTIAAFHAHEVPILEGRSISFPEYDVRLREKFAESSKEDAGSRTLSEVARNFLRSVDAVEIRQSTG